MTKEEKQLLLQDLCARLPYGLICDRLGQARKMVEIKYNGNYSIVLDNGDYIPQEYQIDEIKPYLRPMESMTEEEKKELFQLMGNGTDIQRVDFYNQHLLDYRGLIPMGLALPAKEGMYNN